MKVILSTDSMIAAVVLKEKIIKAVSGNIEDINIETWSYLKSSDDYDIIYHDPTQYIEDPAKNVLFRVQLDGSNVIFSSAWWKKNPEPSSEMICLHVGRLTEMLLRYFNSRFMKFTVLD